MEPLNWLTEPAFVNRHVSPLYFIVVTIIALTVLIYALKTDNKRAVRLYVYAMVVWFILELGLYLTGVRAYNVEQPFPIILIIGTIEDPGWVCLAYMVAEKMMKIHRNE